MYRSILSRLLVPTSLPLLLIISLLLLSLVSAQIESPYPYHACSTSFYTGDTACNNNQQTCCAGTGTCCAGGCCPSTSFCVFKGTSREACCNIFDKTGCGSNSGLPATVTCPAASAPSIPCSGLGQSWYCAPGCTCNVARVSACNCFASCVPRSAGGSASSSISRGDTESTSVLDSGASQTSPAVPAATTPTSPSGGLRVFDGPEVLMPLVAASVVLVMLLL